MAPNRASAEINWYDPDLRGILPITGLHVSKKLRRTIKQQPYEMTFDKAFEAVMRNCADVRPDTWINDEIIALYTELHKQGYAHSVEAWQDGKLVGGLYGIAIGAAFFGESMFSTATDASKISLVYLAARLWKHGFELLDTQFTNEHLKQFGVFEIPRNEYRKLLKKALAKKVSFKRNQFLSGGSAGLGSATAAGSDGPAEGAFLPLTGAAATAGSGVAAEGSASPFTGVPSGAFSEEKSCDFEDVVSFLHSITQTS